MKLRLLVFTSTFPRWENDTDPPFVYELCKRLTDEFDIYVVTPMYPGAAREQVIDRIHVMRFRYFLPAFEKLAGATGILPTIRNNKFYYLVVPFFLLASFFALWSAVRRVQPALIHAHWMIPQGAIACLVGKISRIRYVVTAHGADVFGLRGKSFDTVRTIIMRHADAMVAVSKALRDKLLSGNEDNCRIDIVPMGVDSMSFSRKEQSNFSENEKGKRSRNVLYVGRLTEKKGVRYLLEGIANVKKYYPDVRLTVVGSGELESELTELAHILGLAETVHFTGGLPNILLPDLYRVHNIFVAPSIEARDGDTEGFGLTLVEAGMSGCLVISTGVGGSSDIVVNGETGLIVKQKDSYAIEQALKFAFENPEKMEEIARNTVMKFNRIYDWLIIAGRYGKIYKDVIGDANSHSF